MRTIIMIILITSCGSEESNSKRCYTKDEALSYCIANRIANTGEITATAKLYCEPNFLIERCYLLEEEK